MNADLLAGFAQFTSPLLAGFLLLGTFLGVTVGAVPGLSGSMLIALTLPLTYHMTPGTAIVLLIGMYVGSISGGLISATLLRMPGTAASVITTFDGYPMARNGQAGRALGLGIAASLAGGLLSWVALVLLTEPLSYLATRFGPFEYFALVMIALVLMASVSGGSMAKALLSGFLGILVALPGIDPAMGMPRLTFGFDILISGFKLLPVLLGMFVVSQILSEIVGLSGGKPERRAAGRGAFAAVAEAARQWVNILRSSFIGTLVGILPGVGANIGSMLAYTAARATSKNAAQFGQGSPKGIVASEAANNATVGGALVPMIAMGIPGSVIDVFLMSALMIHSIQPGPLLFRTDADLVYLMFGAYLLANIAMFAIMIMGLRPIAGLARVPKPYLLPVVSVFCVIGAFALDNTWFDVWVMLGFGVLGFSMERAGFPLGPFIIGYILAPMAEIKLRSGLMATGGSLPSVGEHPLAYAMLAASLALLLMPMLQSWRPKRTNASADGRRSPS